MLVQVYSGHYLLAALPYDSIAHVKLAYLGSVYKEVDHGAVAWFTPVCLVKPSDAIGVYGTFAGGVSGNA